MIFFSSCCQCKKISNLCLCDECLMYLPTIEHPCETCGKPMPSCFNTHPLCASCLLSPPIYQRVIAPYHYRSIIKQWILELKFHHSIIRAKHLAQVFQIHLDFFYNGINRPSLIIPIPLHRKRLRQRGYNQTSLIAKALSHVLSIPSSNDHLARRYYSMPQTSLSIEQRRCNVRDCFVATPNSLPRHVALLDDVMTSGHTLNAASQALKQCGVETIDCWVIARA